MRPIDGGDDAGVPSEDPSTKLTYDFESSLVTHLELELYQNRGWIQIIDVRLAKGENVWDPHDDDVVMFRDYFFLEDLRFPLELVMYVILYMFDVSFH